MIEIRHMVDCPLRLKEIPFMDYCPDCIHFEISNANVVICKYLEDE